jgi:hypothetical protein
LLAVARKRVQGLLMAHQPEPLDRGLETKIDAVVKEHVR